MATENTSVGISHPFKVRLVSVLDSISRVGGTILGENIPTEVVFENTPSLSESGGVDYTPIRPIHMPGAVQIYQGTQSRNFSIGATFISRTSQEAGKNMRYLQTLRSWRFPFFGSGTSTRAKNQQNVINNQTNQPNFVEGLPVVRGRRSERDQNQQRIIRENLGKFELQGAPPEVLYLYAYTRPETQGGTLVNLNRIPVVLTGLNITYPVDVDYIPSTYNNEPFPIKMDVSVELAETHSPREFATFSLGQYKQGQLEYF